MKVAHVFWSLTFGGIETMLVNIANEQVKLGAEVHVILINDLCYKALLDRFVDRVTLHLIGRKVHSKKPMFIWKFNRLLHKINPDAIHLHGSQFYGIIFSQRLSRVASSTLHDLPTGSVRRGGALAPFSRKFKFLNFLGTGGNTGCIDKVPKVFAISQAVHDELLEKYGVESTVICNGIKTSMFMARPMSSYNGHVRMVQVGRLLHKKKGQDLLIRAVAALQGKATVDFIGDGNSMEYLKQLASELKVEDYVHFLGKQTQEYIAEHLKDYDLFVQPSRYEGFGLTVAEAMAAQVPVLVSAGQGPAEVTCNDKYGWTFENSNVEDLTSRIDYITEHYDEALAKVVSARQHVVENYDVSVTARRYLQEQMPDANI